MEEHSMITLRMIRQFNVQIEKVFHAWLNKEVMKKWLFTLEETNKLINNDPVKGGSWEIIDHRDGVDYRAIGEYFEINKPNKIVFTFKMPQFSDAADTITVCFKEIDNTCEMTFIQDIHVPQDEHMTTDKWNELAKEYHDSTEEGWNLMFKGLKELLENGEIAYNK